MILHLADLPWRITSPSHLVLNLPLDGNTLEVVYLGDSIAGWMLFHAESSGHVTTRQFATREAATAFVGQAFRFFPADDPLLEC